MEARVAMRGSIGIALEANRLIARLSDGERWVRTLSPGPHGDSWLDLTEALGELYAVAGDLPRELHVALLPPLAHVRRLELPGVSEHEAAQITRRDPSRFLPRREHALDVAVAGTGWRRMSPFLLVAVPTTTIEAIGAAAQQSGWRLGGIVPAQLAWASAGAPHKGGANDVVIVLETHIELLRVRRGTVQCFRRIAGASPGLTASELRGLAARHGVELSDDAVVISSPDDAALVAAERSGQTVGPALLPAAGRVTVRQRQRRGIFGRFAAAAALVTVSAGLLPWGFGRERSAIAAERVRIRSKVFEARAVRESVAALNTRLAAVQSLEMGASHWPTLVAALADNLPSDAFLLSLSASGDTLRLEGGATRAAPVFDALATVAGLKSIHPEGPIRQEIRADGAALEHFVLAASLAMPNGNTPGVKP